LDLRIYAPARLKRRHLLPIFQTALLRQNKRMRILLCNDDGVHAPGIKILHQYLKKIADVVVVGPLEEKSTAGHSLTLHKPLRLIPMGDQVFGVSGSPADCVHVGITQCFKKPPDLVVSGVNRGANLGQDVYYSGTVSAAREACIMGLPALAVSLFLDFKKPLVEKNIHYDTASALAVKVIKKFTQKGKIPLPLHTLLNLNSPNLHLKKIKGISLARQGFRHYSGEIIKRRDHRGRDYFWVGGNYKGYLDEEGTDCSLVAKGYGTLTPLRLDTTYHEYMIELMEDWGNKVVLK
jgi:5'-nucleotidase